MGGCAWRYGKERVGSGEGLGPERVQAADAEIDRDVVLSQRAVERLERRPSFFELTVRSRAVYIPRSGPEHTGETNSK